MGSLGCVGIRRTGDARSRARLKGSWILPALASNRLTVYGCAALIAFLPVATAIAATPASARDSSERILIARARSQPDTIRDELSRAFSATASTRSERERSAHLLRARRLARAYAHAWADSFFVRQVARFESSPASQKQRILIDSLRRAGITAMGSTGVPTAMALWRESLKRANALGEPAAIAPALLSIGAGFYRLGQLEDRKSVV